MKKLLLPLLFTLVSFSGWSQTAASYTFTAFTGTYTSIASTGTSITSIICDDCSQTSISIGFTFNYCGTNYTQLAVCSNGFISLANSGSSPYVASTGSLSGIGSGVGVLMPDWVDLEGFSSIPSTAYYQTSGTAPNRIFTVEWKNFGVYGWPGASGQLNMQVKLYETSNVIDFIYGTSTLSGMGYEGDAIGIANSTTDYQTLNNVTSTPTPSSSTFYTTSITTAPAANQVYRWSLQCAGTPVTGSVSATVDSGCSSFTSVLSLPTATIGTGIGYQWQISYDGTTWSNISGATNATDTVTVTTTAWYRCIVSCSYSGLSATSPAIELFLHTPPGAISGGGTTICSGNTITLTDTTAGGHWVSSSSTIASVGSSTGVVTGGSTGTATITYILPTGCYATTAVTVVTAPGAIGGPPTVCTGRTITLTDPTPGGTYSSSAPSIASVGASTGIVTGVASGVATISYSIGTCVATRTITVNSSPSIISGPTSVCVGHTILLTDSVSGGTWSSSSGAASVGSTTGVVTGVVAGVATITYTLPGSGCYSTLTVTVNSNPGGITGYPEVCVGQTTTLFDFGGGSWTSANPLIASVGATTGVVTGVVAGTTTITYTLPTGCLTTLSVTVQPLPGAITGRTDVCVGATDTLYDTTAGGLWSSSVPVLGSIDAFSGVLTGIAAGTVVISYTAAAGTGCTSTLTVNIDPPPPPITGIMSLCVGAVTTLYDPVAGGTWSSSNPTIASVGSLSGLVTGNNSGTAIIDYTLPTGCSAPAIVTVNALPTPIMGTMVVCVGLTTALSDGTPGGVWSSSNPGIGTVSSSGVVTGIAAGLTTITYIVPSTGCFRTATVTVNSSPALITGIMDICVGSTTTLSDLTPGGGWTGGPSTIATISSTGTVTGVSPGVATVTYSVGSGCTTTAHVTVNALPAVISGPSSVCVGSTIVLTGSPGTTWSSSSTLVATVGSSSGVVTGVGAGIVTIINSNVSNCSRTKVVTVNPLPSVITGPGIVCQGSTIALSDGSPGGVWSAAPTAIGTISTSGVLYGVSPGTVNVTYTLSSTTCATTKPVTVQALPTACGVTGGGGYCAGGTGVHVGLGCSSPGVSYQLYYLGSPLGGPVAGTGSALDFGLQTAAGTYTVVATNATTTCTVNMIGSANVTINPTPTPISGASAVCVAATAVQSTTPPGGVWSSTTPFVATVSSSGVVTGVHVGTTTLSYTMSTGCYATKVMTVSPSPGPISGPLFACTGTSTTTLTDTVPGGTWTSSNPVIGAIGSSSGIVTAGSSTGAVTITYSLGSGCTVTRGLTVDASPAAISGIPAVCQGASTTLGDITTGGTWSSTPITVATVSSTGTVTGVSPGSATVAYTLPSGCSSTMTIAVNPLPAPVLGTPVVCAGSITALSGSISGGAWSSGNPAVASVDAVTGIVTGIAPGTAVITDRLPTGCAASRTVTVNPVPAAIGGTPHVCVGLSTTLTDVTPGGTWTHTAPTVATLTGSTETGVAAGMDTVSYSLGTGCATSQVVTVNPVPPPFYGPSGVCVGQVITLADAVPGGTWSTTSTAISVDATTGAVTGVSFGSGIVTYNAGGCVTTGTVNVITSPMAIAGPSNVCVGNTIPLTDPTTGGIWTSSIPYEGSVGSSSGIVSGIASGTVLISYTLGTGCATVKAVVINPISPILGNRSVCVGLTTNLVDTSLGGSWTSSDTTIARVTLHSGVVSGIATGNAVITYTMTTGCIATAMVTVNSAPPPITGPSTVCVGSAITEADAGPAGTWSSSNAAVASINTITGVVTGVNAGVATISYTVSSTSCPATKQITVNNTPPAISGPGQICVGGTVTISDAFTGGTWTSSAPSVAAIGATTGVVTAGTTTGVTTIAYTLSTGCAATMVLTVNSSPGALTGPTNYCPGAPIALIPPVPGGTWSSSAPLVVSPSMISVGPGTSTISYIASAGCTTSTVVTVNAGPAPIGGATTICQGSTTTLTDASAGGVWATSNPGIAAIDSATGIVTGTGSGSATITYTIPGLGCYVTTPINVNPSPAAITGTPAVCVGAVTSLADATGGGTWSSSAPAIGSVDGAGNVTGIAVGTTTISYMVPGISCAATQVVTVNTLPGPISGSLTLCQGSTTVLTDAPGGGSWTSGNTAIATVSPGGVVTALVTGAGPTTTVSITYAPGAGCSTSATMTINPLPAAITGPNQVCATQSIALSDATGGGSWSSSAPAIGSVDAFGDVTGVTAGVALISYSNSYGCAATQAVTVNTMPAAITGSSNLCVGGSDVLVDAVPGGTWVSGNTAIATVSSAGVVHGVSIGATTIIYEMPPSYSCFVTKVVNVYPQPSAFAVTGGGNHCSGDTGVHIGLVSSALGVNYMLYHGSTAVGTFPGTGGPLDFGLQTVGGTYTVTGTSTLTGCTVNMTGSAFVGVNPAITPSVAIHMTPGDTVCAGTTVTYTTTSTNGGTSPAWQWRINGTPVAVTPGYAFIPADSDVVTVSMTSTTTCATPATVSSTATMHVQPFANPSVSLLPMPGDTVCQGSPVTVNAVTEFGGTAPLYTWVKNGAPVAVATTGSAYTWVPADGDVIFCAVNSNYPCRLASTDTSASLTVHTADMVVPVITISADPGTSVSPGVPVTLTATVTNAVAPTYQWYINGLPIAGATGSSFTSASYGYPHEDSVSCMVTSNGICQTSNHEWVYIRVHPVGVAQVTGGSDVQLLPNPNKGEFMINGTLAGAADQEVSIEITDILGQQVYKSKIMAKAGRLNEKISLPGVANGMYMLTLRSESDSRVFHVVIEQ